MKSSLIQRLPKVASMVAPVLRLDDHRAVPGHEAPPDAQSIEAEQSVLGGLLLDNSFAEKIRELKAIHFVDRSHAVIFGHIINLIASGTRADVVTLADSLQTAGKLDDVGGMSYLGLLVENVPTAAGVPTYARILRERYILRGVAEAAREVEASARWSAGRDAGAIIDDATARFRGLRATVTAVAGPAPLDLADLADQPVPEREYRVGRIMATGTVGEWSGHGGAGKTQCALHLALCLATGRQFFGEPVKTSRVAFVSGEDDAAELHRRLAQQAGRLGISLADAADSLFVYDLTGEDPTLLALLDKRVAPTPRYAWLKGEVERREVDVMILDNRATLFDGDVNVPGTATRAIALFGELAPAGGNVIVLAHVDKATAKAGYGREAYSGTAAWHNRSRWRWYLFQPSAGADALPGEPMAEEDDGRRILEVQKNNAGPTGARFPLRLVDGAIVADGIGHGIVASIERSNERKGILAAMQEAADRGIKVPTAESGRSTAYQALEVLPSYPTSLKGKSGRERLFYLLRQMRADREIEVYEFEGRGRHRREGYCLPGGLK